MAARRHPCRTATPTTFTTEGTHQVTMNVTNGSPVTHDVVVANAPPVAAVRLQPELSRIPGSGSSSDRRSTDCDDSVATVEWDFDDDGLTDSTATNPVHKFDTAGPHDVTLTVTDEDACHRTRDDPDGRRP